MATQNLAVLPSPGFPQIVISDLDTCQFACQDFPCVGEPCSELATVFHLESELEVCARHFREVERD